MSKEMLNDQQANIEELHEAGPGYSLARRVVELAEQGDHIAKDVLRDAANPDPAAQRRARGGLDIISNEGKAATKVIGHTAREVTDNERKRKALAALKKWISEHNGL
jgi:N-acetylglucosamine kinase-like BadF-type ATPase